MPESASSASKTARARYSLRHAAELSGVTLSQLRLWEQRYRLVTPERGEKGTKLYSQDDVELLRYALRETQNGTAIEAIADKVRADRAGVLQTLRSEGPPPVRQIYTGDPRRLPNYDLMLHAITHGEHLKFERLLIQAQAGKNFADSLRTVDLAMMARIGEMTARKQIGPGASQLAVAIIRRRILNHVQSLELGEPAVILAAVPEDWHELGLFGCLLELTQQMIPCLYLGPSVPLSELYHYCDKLRPRAVVLSLTAPLSDEAAADLAADLLPLKARAPIGMGGFEAEQRQALFTAQGFHCFTSVDGVLSWPLLRSIPSESAEAAETVG